MSVKSFTPLIKSDTNLFTGVQIAVSDTSSATKLTANQVKIKCLTQPVYFRLGPVGATVTTSNGYYMAVGDSVRIQTSRQATHILAIRAGGVNGVLSVMPGSDD